MAEFTPKIEERKDLIDGQTYNIGDSFVGGVVVKVYDKTTYAASLKVCMSRSKSHCNKCLFSESCGASDADEPPYLYGLGDRSES